MNTDRELMQQALEALEEGLTSKQLRELTTALRDRLAQPNDFNPDWDAMAVMVEEQQRMAKRIAELEAQPEQKPLTEKRIEELYSFWIVDCQDIVGFARAIERSKPQMQPCAGRNCGSTNPNLHSAECFEDYEKSTGMAQPVAPKCGAIIEVFGKDWRLDYMSLPVGKHKLYTQQYNYTAPAKRAPLTVEEIKKLIHPIVMADLSDEMTDFEIVRAIEAAHGIGEKPDAA